MKYPKIFLAIDNCFASKRWTRPGDWARVIKDLGISYIEASADNELDPLYSDGDYLKDWLKEVRRAENDVGVKVCNLYSGHGSYITCGLAHDDKRVRSHMKKNWFYKLIEMAGELGAGFGFFAHAFSDRVLQDKALYFQYKTELYDIFAELNTYALEKKCRIFAVEQMYSPNQIPWRIPETADMLETIKQKSGNFYFTEDVGHHHVKFVKPSIKDITDCINKFRVTGEMPRLWLGTSRAYAIYEDILRGNVKSVGNAVEEIVQDINDHDYLFSSAEDADCYAWIRELGCFSTIMHLQQTDGTTSAHLNFSLENNAKGKIEPLKVLAELKKSYDRPHNAAMPDKADEIYLTLEIFTSTSAISRYVLQDYGQSVEYWRNYIPKDGEYLDTLLKNY